MPRPTKPPACPRTALLRAKARREAIALAADRRAEAEALAIVKRQAIRAAETARDRQAAEFNRRYDAAMARPAAPLNPHHRPHPGARRDGRARALARGWHRGLTGPFGDEEG